MSYRQMVTDGVLDEDNAQIRAAKALDSLNLDLAERKLANKKSSLGWLFSKRRSAWAEVSGLYIWGDVGRGKTMLMDLFFEHSPIRRKRRVHFHEFMGDVHNRIHAHRQKVRDGKAREDDPIGPVSDALADEVRLLCFDEFTVRDVADAMIMRRLFVNLFRHNVVVVATSNVDPDDLYKDGLRRGDFLPFIDLLKSRVDVLHLNARTDFRLEKLGDQPVYSYPLDLKAQNTMEKAWSAFTGNATPKATTLTVKGRTVDVPRAAAGAARFTFADLCEKPLGAADYLKIAQTFHTVFLDAIPVLTAETRNEAKRFITLIDALYDARVKLVATAEAAPTTLNSGLRDVEAFEFDRTVSRLIEMQSDEYLATPHGPSLGKNGADDAVGTHTPV
ncbi:MAG: cell division protein ZapE [Pseudomonadota bacterium]